MAATLVRKVMLTIGADDGDAQAKLDAIKVKADELRDLHPEMTARIDTAEAQAKMQVLRDELKGLAKGTVTEVKVDTGEAQAKLATLRAEEDATVAKTAKTGEAGLLAGANLEKFGMLGGLALAGVGYESIKMSMNFQSAMERLVTQAGVPTKMLGPLKSGILSLAGAVGFSPESLSESLYHVASNMASLGAKAPEMLAVVKTAAEGAAVGGANLEDVTNALTAAVASGIPGVQNFSQAMGALNAIVGAGDMRMQDLADAFGSGMVAVVKGYGLSLKDVGSALAVFGDNNIRGSLAANELRMAVQALAQPAATGKKALAGIGLTMTSLGSDMRSGGLMKALVDLQAHFKKAGITAKEQGDIITQIFGKKAGTGLNVLMDQMDRLKSKYPAITEGANKFGKAWERTQGTLKQQWAEIRATFDSLMTGIGDKIIPVLSKIAGFLLRNKGILETLAPIILAIVAAFTAWAGIMKIVDILSDMNPWTLAIMAVIAVVVLLVEHWKTVERVAKEVFHAVAHVVEEAVGFIKGHWQLLLAILTGPIGLAVLFIKDNWKHITDAFADVIDWIRTHWQLILAILTGPIGLAVLFIKDHWNKIRHDTAAFAGDVVKTVTRLGADIVSFFKRAFDRVTGDLHNWGSDVLSFFKRLPHDILAALGDLGHLLWQAGVDIVTGLIRGVESMFGAVVHTAENLVSSLGHSVLHLLGIGSPSKVAHGWGLAVAQGMANGIDAGASMSAAAARRMAAGIGTAASPVLAGAGAAAGGRLQVEWVGGQSDQQFMTWIKKNIRIRGGDVSNVGR